MSTTYRGETMHDPLLLTTDISLADTPWGRMDADLGNRDRKKVANNTYLERLDPGRLNFGPIGLRLHATLVIVAETGQVSLWSGGWRTMTTKDRLNYYLPSYRPTEPDHGLVDKWGIAIQTLPTFHCNVSATKGQWKVTRTVLRPPPPDDFDNWADRFHTDESSDFYNGITLDDHGLVIGDEIHTAGDPDATVKKAVKKYTALYTDEEIARLVTKAGENGTAGDCWFCCMVDAETGDPIGGDEHLLDHIAEGYTMASLMLNAVTARGYIDPGLILRMAPDLVRDAVRKYLKQRLAVNTTGATPTGENYSATHPYYN